MSRWCKQRYREDTDREEIVIEQDDEADDYDGYGTFSALLTLVSNAQEGSRVMMLPTKRVSGCPRVIHAWHGRSTHRTASPWVRSVSSDSANGTSMDEDILKTQAAVMKEDATQGRTWSGDRCVPPRPSFCFSLVL